MIRINLQVITEKALISILQKRILIVWKYARKIRNTYSKKVKSLEKEIALLRSKSFLPVGVDFFNGKEFEELYLKYGMGSQARVLSFPFLSAYRNVYSLSDGINKEEVYKHIQELLGTDNFYVPCAFMQSGAFTPTVVIFCDKFKKLKIEEGFPLAELKLLRETVETDGGGFSTSTYVDPSDFEEEIKEF